MSLCGFAVNKRPHPGEYLPTVPVKEMLLFLLFLSVLVSVSSASNDAVADASASSWPVFRNDCFVAYFTDSVTAEGRKQFYRTLEDEATVGLNVTKVNELEESASGFIFLGDEESASKVSESFRLYIGRVHLV